MCEDNEPEHIPSRSVPYCLRHLKVPKIVQCTCVYDACTKADKLSLMYNLTLLGECLCTCNSVNLHKGENQRKPLFRKTPNISRFYMYYLLPRVEIFFFSR